jgi:hypothetical protein
MIPSFLLAKLYVKGSLKNHENGFELKLKNIIDSTWLTGIGPITAAGIAYEGNAILMIVGEQTFNGGELSTENKVPVKMGVPITVRVTGAQLPPGVQKLGIAATTSDIGKIKFEISDTVA